MDEKDQKLLKLLVTDYKIKSPVLGLTETFQGNPPTVLFYVHNFTDAQGDNYKLVEYYRDNFKTKDDLVRWMKNAEEDLSVDEYVVIEPLTSLPQYTLYKLILETD